MCRLSRYLRSESVNLLQPSVFVQACTGIALLFTNQTQEILSSYVVPERVIEAGTSRLESKQEILISTYFDLSRKDFQLQNLCFL